MSLFALALLSLAPIQPGDGETLRYDNRGRPVVAVALNDQGPFEMVVDTAAQVTLIAPALGETLKLKPQDSDIRIAGATGSARAQIYPVDRLANRLIDVRYVGLLALSTPQVTSASGILGMDGFTTRKLLFDRTARMVRALPSAPAEPGFATLAGKRRDDGLIDVPVRINGVTVNALVDTGAAVSIGNAAALRALGWQAVDPRLRSNGQIRGATAGVSNVAVAEMATIAIGPATLGNVPLHFTTGEDGEAPSLILGADLLNLFEAFAVDFPRAELQIRLPRKSP